MSLVVDPVGSCSSSADFGKMSTDLLRRFTAQAPRGREHTSPRNFFNFNYLKCPFLAFGVRQYFTFINYIHIYLLFFIMKILTDFGKMVKTDMVRACTVIVDCKLSFLSDPDPFHKC